MSWGDLLRNRSTEQKISIFAWLSLLLAMLYLFIFPNPHWVDYTWGAAVLTLEITASLWGGLPLSPIMQAIDDRGADNAPWWRGPRAVAATVAAVMALYYGHIVDQASGGSFWLSAAAVVFVGGLFTFNFYHWARPEKYDA